MMWDSKNLDLALEILEKHNIKSVDITPWEYLVKGWTPQDVRNLRAKINKFEINIVALQGLYHKLNFANLFDITEGRKAFVRRSIECIQIANLLGAKFLIAGAPLTREPRSSNDINCLKFGYAETISSLISFLKENNIIYCIEPVAKRYGEKLVTSSKIAFEICSIIDSPFVKVNIDTGFSTNEDHCEIRACKSLIAHGHLSKPDFSMVDSNCFARFNLEELTQHWSVEVSKSFKDLPKLCQLINHFKYENRFFTNCCTHSQHSKVGFV